MFIDYLTLIMINLVAGSVLLAYYLWKGLDAADQRPYAAAFFVTGLVGMVTGLQLSFSWPLPGSFNVGYGDAATLFGVVFLGWGENGYRELTNRLRPISIVSPSPKGWRPLTGFVSTLTAPCIGST